MSLLTFFAKLQAGLTKGWNYYNSGVWSDGSRKWWKNGLRVLNLSVNSFLNKDIQSQACAMTYRTLLAVVPALALLVAIGRGFGIQDLLEQELYKIFPAQHFAITYGIRFVDSYLAQSSEGIFVGVGVLFLLWTLISLIGNMEDVFNLIWGGIPGRSIWRKITDYTAMLLILPVLMICASGISILVSTTLRSMMHFAFLTPLISWLLEIASWVITWLFFGSVYMLLPNTKVKFKNAIISGIIAGTAFMVLQWLFVSGTIYVTKYNAIYGSVAFVPLLLIWMQLAWVICMAGAVVCFSSQNVFAFNLEKEVGNISGVYKSKSILAMTAVVTQRFIKQMPPITQHELMERYEFPARMVSNTTDLLCAAGIFSRTLLSPSKETIGYQLAVDPSLLTITFLAEKIEATKSSGFVQNFDSNFKEVDQTIDSLLLELKNSADRIHIADIKVKL